MKQDVTPSDIEIINDTLRESIMEESGINLSVEVMWSAMRYLQQHPGASIEDACGYGLNEWLK